MPRKKMHHKRAEKHMIQAEKLHERAMVHHEHARKILAGIGEENVSHPKMGNKIVKGTGRRLGKSKLSA